MDLINGENQEKENKGKKIVVGSLITTIVLIILVVIAIFVLKETENNTLKLIVNGKSMVISEDLLITDFNTGKSYFSISQVANLVEYDFYNGEYKQYTEDKTKCYVECENELAMFELNSNVIYKNNADDKLNFDSYVIDEPVISYNNALYATTQAIQTAFNTRVIYDDSNNTVYLESLPYLVNYYETVATQYGYAGISQEFATQKVLAKNMLVVQKEEKYGVVSIKDFSTIIGSKYDSINYLENTQEFIVTNEGKTGIISTKGEMKIGLRYDEVGLVDGEAGLYYAKNDNLYGVLNKNGRVLVFIEYDDIGIDRNIFPLDNIKNNMFLYENCIPLKKGTKWGLADKNGNIILNFEYDKLGYAETELIQDKDNNTIQDTIVKDKSINNVVVIPDIEGIVVGKGEKYGVVNKIGKVIIPCEFDKIYSITNEGKDEYYLEKNGRTTKLTKFLTDNKINVENSQNTSNNANQTTNNIIKNETNNNVTNSMTNQTTNKNNTGKIDESIIIM